MSHSSTLRALLAGPQPVIAPGVFSPIIATLAAEAQFKAIYMTGAGVAAGLYGQPDVGLVTQTEIVDAARRIVDVAGLPLICDADTGYGGVLNVRRTVEELESAGVAGLHLEDQEFPKRCGFLDLHALAPVEDMVARIKAATDARRDPALLIIARTEILGAASLDETIERACRYREAGADMTFCNGILREADAERLAREIPGPHLYNVSTSGRTPHLAADRLQALGFSLVIYPAHALFLAIKTIADMFAALMREGTIERFLPDMIDFAEWQRVTGITRMEELERKYVAGSEL